MQDKVVIPFTQLEKDLLSFFEEREDGLRVADVVEQFCARYAHHKAPEIKAALWQLLAERYLTPVSRSAEAWTTPISSSVMTAAT